jgi:uncharacterized protein (DUF1800 family)
VRASGLSVTNTKPLNGTIALLGMPLYHCVTPDGYKNTQAAWLNPNAMTERLNFATGLASGRLPLNQEPPKIAEEMEGGMKKPEPNIQSGRITPLNADDLITTTGNSISAATRTIITAGQPPLRAALVLGSPDFMRR